MPAAVAALSPPAFAIEFGRPATSPVDATRGAGLDLHLPVLAGESREFIFPGAINRRDVSGLQLAAAGDLLLGCATEPIADERTLAARTEDLYRRLLTATRGRHLYRIWNYVPRINAVTNGLENYRAFCKGRSLAFEAEAGTGFPQVLPSASGVGIADGCLSVVFVAGDVAPRHFENPEQVPAYRYPSEHGPRAPSFSRATVAALPGRTFTFISGTAAIKGHQTVAPHDLRGQLDCTLDNLRLISRAAGHGDDLAAGRAQRRHVKVYLRHPADLAAVRSRLETDLLRPADHVSYLHSDICRGALDVEIEVTLLT